MKKKILYLIFMLIVMFSFNSGVKAVEYTVGVCNYHATYRKDNSDKAATLKIELKDNGAAYDNFYGSSEKLTLDSNSNTKMFTNGQCYKYVGVNKGGLFSKNSSLFTDNSNDILGYDYRYELDDVPATTCYYDLSYRNGNQGTSDTYVRLKLFKAANGSIVKAYTLGASNSFEMMSYSNISNGKDVTYFKGTKEGDVITYYLNETGTAHLGYSGLYHDFGAVLADDMNGICPTIRYDVDSNNNIILKNGSSAQYTALPNSTYKASNGDGQTEQQQDSNASGSSTKIEKLCTFNGTYYEAGNSSNGSFTYNFVIKRENDTTLKYCVTIDQKEVCADLNGNVYLSLSENIESTFGLDNSLRNFLNKSSFSCPPKDTLHLYYENTVYYFTNLSQVSDNISGPLNDGELDDTSGTGQSTARKEAEERAADQEGTDVSGCEGLIGPNVLGFIKLIRNFIMIAGPILALVLGTYDLVVALAGGDDEAKKKGIKKMKNRLVAAVLLLLIPYILVLLLNIINNASIDPSCIIK